MDKNIEFHIKKKIIDYLYTNKLISATEWYSAIKKLIKEYNIVKTINIEI